MNFNFDHDALPAQQVPPDDQTPDGLAFIKVLLSPFKKLYNDFVAARNARLYKLKFTAQVIYLEKLLNQQFNNDAPAYTGLTPTGIYIGKPLANVEIDVLRMKVETRPALVLWKKNDPAFNALAKKIVLRKKIEYLSNLDFIIYVPFACFNVTTDMQKTIKMKGWINFYNDIANYSIVNY